MKKNPFISGLFSSIIWGSGQIYNGDFIKGFFIFIIFAVTVIAEITSGYYVEYFIFGLIQGDFDIRYAGFFVKGIWGLLSLGDTPGIGKDHSIVLMIQGIIAILFLAIIIVIYISNIKDAVLSAKKINKTGKVINNKEYLNEFFNNSFEYIFILPSIIILLFFTVMPILFSFLLAFTSYDIRHIPPMKLVDWVGFSNFKKIYQLPIWGKTFVGVFSWNVIWAVCATLSCFYFRSFSSRYIK